MTSQVTTISGSLAALNAVVGPAQMANGRVTLYLASGLTGTVQLQARPTGSPSAAFEPLIPSGTTSVNITAAGVYAFPPLAGDLEFQVACTAFTSGSGAVTLMLAPSL